jgi:hypothetical protein
LFSSREEQNFPIFSITFGLATIQTSINSNEEVIYQVIYQRTNLRDQLKDLILGRETQNFRITDEERVSFIQAVFFFLDSKYIGISYPDDIKTEEDLVVKLIMKI